MRRGSGIIKNTKLWLAALFDSVGRFAPSWEGRGGKTSRTWVEVVGGGGTASAVGSDILFFVLWCYFWGWLIAI